MSETAKFHFYFDNSVNRPIILTSTVEDGIVDKLKNMMSSDSICTVRTDNDIMVFRSSALKVAHISMIKEDVGIIDREVVDTEQIRNDTKISKMKDDTISFTEIDTSEAKNQVTNIVPDTSLVENSVESTTYVDIETDYLSGANDDIFVEGSDSDNSNEQFENESNSETIMVDIPIEDEISYDIVVDDEVENV